MAEALRLGFRILLSVSKNHAVRAAAGHLLKESVRVAIRHARFQIHVHLHKGRRQ